MKKNFEITYEMKKNVKKYAQFFYVSEISMLSILFSMGEKLYMEEEDIQIKETFGEKHNKVKQLEQDYELYSQGVEYKKLKGDYKSEDDFVQKYENRANIKKNLTRLKINMSDEQCEKVQQIVKTKSSKGKKICDSDIICYFISCGLKKLKYLKRQPDWGINICEDAEFMAPKEVYLTIPRAFYMCLDNRACELNISVSDYIKILIEEKFDNDKEIMIEQIREQVEKR